MMIILEDLMDPWSQIHFGLKFMNPNDVINGQDLPRVSKENRSVLMRKERQSCTYIYIWILISNTFISGSTNTNEYQQQQNGSVGLGTAFKRQRASIAKD